MGERSSLASRFLERMENGPTVVADGGMGALISAAVPRLRSPEEANLRAPDAVVSLHVCFINAGAELIETNTFGANRRKLAAALPRGRLRADQLDGGQARARRARDHRPRRVHRRLDRADRRGGDLACAPASCSPSRRRSSRGAAPTCSWSRRSTTWTSSCDAIEAVRGVSCLPIVALMTFDDGAETLAGVRARGGGRRGWRARTSPRSARTTARA